MNKPATQPAWVAALLDRELLPMERLLLALLARYQGGNGSAWPSRAMLARDLGATERTVERLVGSLATKGRLVVKRPERQGRGIRNRYVVHVSNKGRQECPPSDTSKGDVAVPLPDTKGRQACRKKGDKRRHVTKVYNEECVSETVTRGRARNSSTRRRQSQRKFIPPTVQEVCEYAEFIGYSLDAEQFCDYYAANGWRVGRNPMRDWRAAVRTWRRRDEAGNGKPKQESVQDDDLTEEEIVAKARAGGSKLAWLTGEVANA